MIGPYCAKIDPILAEYFSEYLDGYNTCFQVATEFNGVRITNFLFHFLKLLCSRFGFSLSYLQISWMLYAGQISAIILAIISLVVFAVVTAERRQRAFNSLEEDQLKTSSYGRSSPEKNDGLLVSTAERNLNGDTTFRYEAIYNQELTDAASDSQRDGNSILDHQSQVRGFRLVYWALLTALFKLGIIEVVDTSSMGV